MMMNEDEEEDHHEVNKQNNDLQLYLNNSENKKVYQYSFLELKCILHCPYYAKKHANSAETCPLATFL